MSRMRGLVSSARAMPTRWRSPPDRRSRHAFEQGLDAEQRHRVVELHPARRRRDAAQAELQVAPHRQVREQAGLLEHVAELAAVSRHQDAARVVLPAFAIDHQAAARRRLQPGDAAQQRGLARAGVAEQRGDAAPGQAQVNVEAEAGVGHREARLDAGGRRGGALDAGCADPR